MIDEADGDGKGGVSKDDFVKVMRRGPCETYVIVYHIELESIIL